MSATRVNRIMPAMRHIVLALSADLVVAIISLLLAAGTAHAQKQELIKPEGIGDACGFVVDDETGKFLSKAEVTLILPDNFEEIRGSKGRSGDDGFYQVKAPLGTVKTRFATERLLDLNIASLLTGGARAVERTIDISQLNISVFKPGYKPFRGPLPVRSIATQAGAVWLCTVRLVPENSKYLSYNEFGERTGEILDLSLGTSVALHNDKIDFKARVRGLPVRIHDKVNLYFTFDDHLLNLNNEWREVGGKCKGDEWEFSGQVEMAGPASGFIRRTREQLSPGLYAVLFDWGRLNTDEIRRGNIREGQTRLETRRYIFLDADPSVRTKAEKVLIRINSALGGQGEMTAAEFNKVWGELKALYPEGTSGLHGFSARDYFALRDILIADQGIVSSIGIGHDAVSAKEPPADVLQQVEYYRKNPPGNFMDRLKAAEALRRAGKKADAVKCLAGLEKTEGATCDEMMALGRHHYDWGEHDAALKTYDVLFKRWPREQLTDFRANMQYGLLKLRRGEADQALDLLNRAMAGARKKPTEISSSTYVSYRGEGGNVFIGALRYTSAGFVYPEAVHVQLLLSNHHGLDGKEWMVAASLGRAMAALGLKEQSLTLLQGVARNFPDEQYVLASYALVLEASGDRTAAGKVLQKLLALNPRHPEGLKMQQRLKVSPSLERFQKDKKI